MKTYLVKYTGSDIWIPVEADSSYAVASQLLLDQKSGTIKGVPKQEVTQPFDWTTSHPNPDVNIQDNKKEPNMVKTTTQGGAMIKEYLIETTTIEDTVISRVITNDPNYWLTKVGVVTIHEIDRGNYKFAMLEDRFASESFCVTITAFKNPFTNEYQKVDSSLITKPKDIIFGYADFDAETTIRIKGYNSKDYVNMAKYGFVIGNSDKMVKRLVELVKSVSGYAIHKGDSKKLRIKVLSYQEIRKALPHLVDDLAAEKTMDGISIGAVETVRYVYRNSGHGHIVRQINDNKITNHTVRITTNVNGVAGLIKGNLITGQRQKINARFRDLGIIGKNETYDIFTSVDNFKKEFGTDGTWEMITLEPHHGPGIVKTNDQMLAQYQGIPGVFEFGEMLDTFQVVLDKAFDDMVEGKDIEMLNNIMPERATTEAEKISHINDGQFTSKTNKMAAMLNDLDLGIGVSQTMMFMRANGLKKMFLDEYDNTGSLRKVGTCWKAPSKSKKSFVFMPWAYRAYIMTKEVVYLAGYDVDLTNDEGMYHEETQTFMIPGNQAAEILGKLGGADLDDEVGVHIRTMITKDDQIRLVAFIVRTPNDWSEFHIMDVDGFGPVFLGKDDGIHLPTIYEKDFDKFNNTARNGKLPSKVRGSDRPQHPVWNWELTRYNYNTSLYKGAGVGGQVKTKMLWYSTYDSPFNTLPCANEDMIDALQQCKGDKNDLSTLVKWSDSTLATLVTEKKIDAYWWYSRNMNAACIRLKQSKAINSWLGNLSPEQSPIVRDFMIPREMMVRETHNKMISWLNVNIKEIPELNITIHSQNEDRFRKLVTELKNQFTVPANIKNDKAAISEHYDNVAIAIADRFASYKERLNDDVKFHKFILSMTRMSYIRKSESVKLKHDDRNNFDRWLFTSPKNSDHMVLEYFYEAMLWFRNRDK